MKGDQMDTTESKTATAAMPAAGSFVWNEMMTPDVAAARTFFAGVLGWEYEERDMGEHGRYTMIRNKGSEIGGMMQMDGPMWQGIPPHWMAYIAVDDVDACARKVEAMGGKVCVPPTDIPGVGRFTVINDPTGATISLITLEMPAAAQPLG